MDDTDNVISIRVGKEVESDEFKKEKWKKQINDHKMLVLFITSWHIFYLKQI